MTRLQILKKKDTLNANTSLFLALLKREGIPAPILEHRFAADRKWRWDFAWTPAHLATPPLLKWAPIYVALEVDGGLYSGGAHVRGARIEKTHDKLNAAAVLGWRVLYTTPRKLCSAGTLALLRQALGSG